MTGLSSGLWFALPLLAIAYASGRVLRNANRPRPQPVRLEDVAGESARALLVAAKDPTLHPAVAAELRSGVLTITGLRTAGRSLQASRLLRQAQSLSASRSLEEADLLATQSRALLATLPSATGQDARTSELQKTGTVLGP